MKFANYSKCRFQVENRVDEGLHLSVFVFMCGFSGDDE